MDYVMSFVDWELDLRDLKKMSLNGITYSGVDEAMKKDLKENVFPKLWKKFLDILIEKYGE
jgi:hypothetical protein